MARRAPAISFLAALAALGVALSMAAGVPSAGHSESAVARATVETYLFLPRSDTYLVGDRIAKWEADPLVVLYRETDRKLVQKLVDRIHQREAMGEWRILILPPIDELRAGGYDNPTLTLDVDTAGFERFMAKGPLRGLEAYHEAAWTRGCYARPEVSYARRDFVIRSGYILAREGLEIAVLEDCFFRGLLLVAGLMYSSALALDEGLMNPDERAAALSVLSLVYRPEVEPGMTRDDFYAALGSAGLIGP